MDKRFFTIALILFTEVLGWSLILPFLPYYAESLGATPLIVGLIMASFSLCQFISAPIIGRLSDYYGRKPMLIISQLSTMTGFIVLGFANSVWMIFLSRIIDGLLGSNATLVKAYLSDLSKGKERFKSFGYFGAINGLGMFIGPAIGGFLAVINYMIPSLVAASISFVSIILTIMFLKETIKRKKKVVIKREDYFPMKSFLKGLRKPHLKDLFIEFLLLMIGFSIITSTLSLYVKHQLGFGPSEVAGALMIVGFLMMIYQATALPKIIDKYRVKSLKKYGLAFLALSAFLMPVITNRTAFYSVMPLFSIGVGLTRPLMTGEVSKKSRKKEYGQNMGVLD